MSVDFKFLMLSTLTFLSAPAVASPAPGMPEVLGASPAADRRELDLDNAPYVEVPGGGVFIELTPALHPSRTDFPLRAGHRYGMAWSRVGRGLDVRGAGGDHSS